MNKPGWLPENAHDRAREKAELVLDWLVRFHYSNAAILMRRLGLQHAGNLGYFRKLTDKGLLRSVAISTVRRPVLMLTPAGLSLLENNPLTARYNWDERRIAASLTRHHLAVQVAVLNRREHWSSFTPERLLRKLGRKMPDALIEKDGVKTALEVELNYKSRQQIYIGLLDHVRAIRDGHYARVEYIFTHQTMRDYYRNMFDSKEWPVYRWDDKSKRYKMDGCFDADKSDFQLQVLAGAHIPSLKCAFSFTVEELRYE